MKGYFVRTLLIFPVLVNALIEANHSLHYVIPKEISVRKANRSGLKNGKRLKNSSSFPPLAMIPNSRRKFLGAIVGTGAIAGTGASLLVVGEAYSRLGNVKPFNVPVPDKGWESVEKATIIFHGAGGPDAYTDELLQTLAKQNPKTESNYYTLVDWSDYSKDLLQASFNGQRIGKQIASSIMKEAQSLKSLHVIGISVGAFAADACAKEMKNKSQLKKYSKTENSFIQLTLLDPFCSRGVFGIRYGANNFGKNVDYAQQYMNTDDPVPSTNFPLRNCAVTDVTNVRPSSIFGHDWPLVYYARHGIVDVVPIQEQRPKGDVVSINSIGP